MSSAAGLTPFAKAAPPGVGYNFLFNGGMEIRFVGTRWIGNIYRSRFRWQAEYFITDVDGSFADQRFCDHCGLEITRQIVVLVPKASASIEA